LVCFYGTGTGGTLHRQHHSTQISKHELVQVVSPAGVDFIIIPEVVFNFIGVEARPLVPSSIDTLVLFEAKPKWNERGADWRNAEGEEHRCPWQTVGIVRLMYYLKLVDSGNLKTIMTSVGRLVAPNEDLTIHMERFPCTETIRTV
jgi:hypothetical protein